MVRYRLYAFALVSVFATACTIALDVPENVLVQCTNDDQCPSDFLCEVDTGFCVSTTDRDPVTSLPEVVLPAGQDATKDGDIITIVGTGERGAEVVAVRLVYVADAGPTFEFDPTNVAVDDAGDMAGELLLPSTLVDGARFRIEVILRVLGRLSVGEQSRSSEVQVDNTPPPAPLAANLRLTEIAPTPDVQSTVDDSNNTFEIEGLLGAFLEGDVVRIYATETRAQLLQEVALTGGVLATQTFPHVTGERFFIVSVDNAGNESDVTILEVPQFQSVTVTPSRASDGLTVEVTFDTSIPVSDLPELELAGRAGTCEELSVQSYRCTFVPDAVTDLAAEGIDAAVLRLRGEHGVRIGGNPAQAAGSVGTAALSYTLDFTPPSFSAGDIGLSSADPGSSDSVAGLAGAVTDAVGGTPETSANAVSFRILDEDTMTEIDAFSVGGDGSFTSVDLGDNVVANVLLEATDIAGNVATTTLVNDIVSPSIDSFTVTPAAQRDGQMVLVDLDVSDNLTDLRGNPVIFMTNGGAMATLSSGSTQTSMGPQSLQYSFTADSGRDAETTHTVDVTVTDSAGNIANTTGSLILDYTNPTSVNTLPGVRAEWKGTPGVQGTSSDALAGVSLVEVQITHDLPTLEYWNGTAFTTTEAWVQANGTTSWDYSVAVSYVEAEDYSIRWRSTDGAGNIETTQGPLSFAFDGIPPQTSITAQPAALTDSLDAGFSFSCDDPPCTYECSLDGGAFAACPESAADTYTSLPTGEHTVDVRAIDGGLNVDPTPASYTWTIRRLWQQVATHLEHTCAIAQDNNIWCWGRNNFDQLGLGSSAGSSVPTPARIDTAGDWDQITTGDEHTCAIKLDGTLWCWGNGQNGQLGIGPSSGVDTPTQVETATDWAQVSAGPRHTCGLRDDGMNRTIWCWGRNSKGELGVGDTSSRDTPTQEATMDVTWVQVDAGGAFGNFNPDSMTCGRRGNNTLWCWGAQDDGRLGNGIINGSTGQPNPDREATNGTNWIDVSVGGSHACGVRSDNSLWCWGMSFFGKLGSDQGQADIDTPTQEDSMALIWEDVEAGPRHTCARTTGDEIRCFGEGEQGQLGFGSLLSGTSVPVSADGGSTNWSQMSLGGVGLGTGGHTCAVRFDGTLACFGGNVEGVLGLGGVALESRNLPAVSVAGTFESLDIHSHGCAVTTAGELWCWGNNNVGQIGDGTTTYRGVPVEISSASVDHTWLSVALGQEHTCGIQLDGTSGDQTVWCWGENALGQTGTDNAAPFLVSPTQEFTLAVNWTAVGSGADHTCGVRGGELWCWGDNTTDALGLGPAGPTFATMPMRENTNRTDWKQVTANKNNGFFPFTCAVTTGGLLFCWGEGRDGRLGTGNESDQDEPTQVGTDTDWDQVDSGLDHSCAVKTTGSLWCWGSNNQGAIGDGSQGVDALSPEQEATMSTNWASAAAGSQISCGRRLDGTLWCWGWNVDGRAGYGNNNQSPTPVQEGTASTAWTTVDLGREFSCAIASGDLYCWGSNERGELADGNSIFPTPQDVSQLP